MARLRSAAFIRIAVGLVVLQTWLVADAGGTAMALTLSTSAFTPGGKIP